MESDKTIEARRKAQRNGEEDPVVVAQRFLNIYRQIHVFNAEKKASFNQMLMELSPEIRGIFGNLPGGTLLQEYVDELAEQNGIEKSINTNDLKTDDEDAKQAKILATALAEAQVQAAERIQNVAPRAPILTSSPATETKLSMDKNFAQEFANALSVALNKNSQGVDKELKSIIANLGRSQTEMIKILKNERGNQNNFISPSYTTQSNQSSYFPDFENTASTIVAPENNEVIQQLINGQQQILTRLEKVENNSIQSKASTNNINLEKLISNLYENQKRDSMKMAQTIAESQNKLAKAIVQNNTLNQNSSNININSTDYSGILANIADKLGKMSNASQKIEVKFPMQPFNALINTQSAIYREIATAQNKERSTIITELLKANRLYLESIANTINSQPIIVPPTINTNIEDYAISETSVYPYEEANTINSNYSSDINFANPDAAKKKKKKKKNKSLDNDNVSEKMTLTDTLVSTISKGFDLLKHKDETAKASDINNDFIEEQKLDTAVFEQNVIQSPIPSENEEILNPVVEEVLPEIEKDIETKSFSDAPTELQNLNEDKNIILEDTVKEETLTPLETNFSIEETNEEENIPSFVVNDDLNFDDTLSFEETSSADDWGFSNVDDTHNEPELNNASQSWNFSSDEDGQEDTTDDEEWVWEYVEADENTTSDEQEWEYVEVDANSELADDEEWEYVEVEDTATENPNNNETESVDILDAINNSAESANETSNIDTNYQTLNEVSDIFDTENHDDYENLESTSK